MRNILFRGKREYDGKWMYGGIVNQKDNYGDTVNDWYIIDALNTCDYDIGEATKVIPETIGQYTGKDTVFGTKPIFEGDIVKGKALYYGTEIEGVVVFQNNKFVVRCYDKNCIASYEMKDFHFDVISNVHDSLCDWSDLTNVK